MMIVCECNAILDAVCNPDNSDSTFCDIQMSIAELSAPEEL